MRINTFVLALTAVAAFTAGAAQASTNLVKNGGFELTTNGTNKQLGTVTYVGTPLTQLTGWTTGGYNFVFNGNTADTVGANGLTLWGPGSYDGRDAASHNGLGASPTGGNFVSSDPVYFPAPIAQTINGLVVGKSYTLTFSYALAQQMGFAGANLNDYWDVSLGSTSQKTDALSIGTAGFSGWKESTMTFKATTSSELLSFLAKSGPAGAPPFLLLDGVSLTAAVPEPSTWGMLLGGLGLVGFMARRRRQSVAA